MSRRKPAPRGLPQVGKAGGPREMGFWRSVDHAELFRAIAADGNRVFVMQTLRKLTHDPVWTDRILHDVSSGHIELRCVLAWLAAEMRPRTYLEVGVRRGFSMAVVAARVPDAALFGFDAWIQQYGGVTNPGPPFVRSELDRVGFHGRLYLVDGNSHRTLPAAFRLPGAPLLERIRIGMRRVPWPKGFDLITIDGDHSLLGAYQDLIHTMPLCKVGGVVVFDDIAADTRYVGTAALAAERGVDPHGWGDLLGVWRAIQAQFNQFRYFGYLDHPPGVGLAVRLA